MEELESWVMKNYLTGGYQLQFEDLTVSQLLTFRAKIDNCIEQKRQKDADNERKIELLQKRAQIERELQELE